MTGPEPRVEGDPDPAAVVDAARSRRRRRDERHLAAAESGLAGVLAGLAAGGVRTTITTTTGARRAGRVQGLGADVVALVDRDRLRWVRLDAVASIEADEPLRVAAAGDRAGVTLEEVVAGLAGTGEVASFTMAGGSVVTGAVGWCGNELAGLGSEGGAATKVVYLASVSEVSLAAPSAPASE